MNATRATAAKDGAAGKASAVRYEAAGKAAVVADAAQRTGSHLAEAAHGAGSQAGARLTHLSEDDWRETYRPLAAGLTAAPAPARCSGYGAAGRADARTPGRPDARTR